MEHLAAQWRDATPFAHAIADDVLSATDLDAVMILLDEEPVEHAESDIFSFDATAPEPTTQSLRELRDSFARDLAPVVTRIGGRAVSRVDMRAYAYRPGHYLLPHTDHQERLGRVYAYAFYLPSPEPPIDGDLELFAGMTSAKRIAPRANRLVVFDVGDHSLHQVREVLGGLRISLAGWFYP